MSDFTQVQLEMKVLRSLYDWAQANTPTVTSDIVANLLFGQFGEQRIKLALSTLERQGLIKGSHNSMSGSRYSISEKGYKLVEQELLGEIDDQNGVPASDRIVGFDHNSSEFMDARKQISALEAALVEANDIGGLSPREASVAAVEVKQIGQMLDQEFVRPIALWQRARNCFKWIGTKAAEAMIGSLALAALALLGHLLGFS